MKTRDSQINQLVNGKKVVLKSIPADIMQKCVNPALNYHYIIFSPWNKSKKGSDLSAYRQVFQNAFEYYNKESKKRNNPTSLVYVDIIGTHNEYLEIILCSTKVLSSPSKAMQLFSSHIMKQVPSFGEIVDSPRGPVNRVFVTVGVAELQKGKFQQQIGKNRSRIAKPAEVLAFMGYLLTTDYQIGDQIFQPTTTAVRNQVLNEMGEIVGRFMK